MREGEVEPEVAVVAERGDDDAENAELVLFQVKECYVYMIPPRKSAASYRADEWDINKWAWEGVLKVLAKGESCTIRLEDSKTGELYAQAPVREDQPLPVEAVIDSSRFFVLRLEDTASGKNKHAFVGLGFRERPQAYDFQAALFDHLKEVISVASHKFKSSKASLDNLAARYLNKKKEAEEMEQEYQTKPSADYSLKEGETLRLQLNTQSRSSGSTVRSTLGNTGFDSSTGRQPMPNPDTPENYPRRLGANGLPTLAPPPPPPLLQPVPKGSTSPLLRVPSMSGPKLSTRSSMTEPDITVTTAVPGSAELGDNADADEDFGDFKLLEAVLNVAGGRRRDQKEFQEKSDEFASLC